MFLKLNNLRVCDSYLVGLLLKYLANAPVGTFVDGYLLFGFGAD